MKFEVGQVFENSYPPEAAMWCNENKGCQIVELGNFDDEIRRFQIIKTPDTSDENQAEIVRARRNSLIEETDFLLMSDYPISEENLALVKAYRQALRDIPKQEGFPRSVEWPEKPEVIL